MAQRQNESAGKAIAAFTADYAISQINYISEQVAARRAQFSSEDIQRIAEALRQASFFMVSIRASEPILTKIPRRTDR